MSKVVYVYTKYQVRFKSKHFGAGALDRLYSLVYTYVIQYSISLSSKYLLIGLIYRLNHQFSFSGSNILQTSPSAMHRLRDSSSSDIQIAAESDLSRERARFSLQASSCSSSSLRALCGPNPAKISLVCVLVISVWLMAVLVMHLDKKLSLTTETLEDTREKIQTIQDAVEGDRCGRLLLAIIFIGC